jgi:predicted dehydrogenase
VLTTDPPAVFEDDQTNAIVVATRHESHADLVTHALRSGKSVFVEKPLAIGSAQLANIQSAWTDARNNGQVLTVGFNRRFAPLAQQMKRLVDATTGPKCIVYTVNAGAIPSDHWTQDSASGGGRIVGEACHFIDFMRWLVGHPIREWRAMAARQGQQVIDDCASITFSFADGSLGTVHYFANGGKAFPKERVEVFAGGAALRLDDYRTLQGFGWRGFRKQRLWKQDKGQTALVAAFLAAVGGRAAAPIPIAEIFEVAEVAIDCGTALRPSLGAL